MQHLESNQTDFLPKKDVKLAALPFRVFRGKDPTMVLKQCVEDTILRSLEGRDTSEIIEGQSKGKFFSQMYIWYGKRGFEEDQLFIRVLMEVWLSV